MSTEKSYDAVQKKTRHSHKIREIALILPIIGVVLFLTPILTAFTVNDETSQLTNSMVYIFGIWAALIIAAFFLSRALLPEIRKK